MSLSATLCHVSLPKLSQEERSAAAAAALVARRRRAEVKAQIAAREITVPEVLTLAEEDNAVGKMRVIDMLLAYPRIGPVRAHRIMEKCDISHSRRLRGLGDKQRQTLLEYFAAL
ncbi:MAG: integration host factor MihF [Geovibrio sp.]|nr:integration host factor MihF [Geovibrio sp.]